MKYGIYSNEELEPLRVEYYYILFTFQVGVLHVKGHFGKGAHKCSPVCLVPSWLLAGLVYAKPVDLAAAAAAVQNPIGGKVFVCARLNVWRAFNCDLDFGSDVRVNQIRMACDGRGRRRCRQTTSGPTTDAKTTTTTTTRTSRGNKGLSVVVRVLYR